MVKHDNRLFAFGCSFTRYDTDTYADYIGKNYKEFYNYGNPGSGNAQIATTLSEKILEHDINKNDRVIVQWSSISNIVNMQKGMFFDLNNPYARCIYAYVIFVKCSIDTQSLCHSSV